MKHSKQETSFWLRLAAQNNESLIPSTGWAPFPVPRGEPCGCLGLCGHRLMCAHFKHWERKRGSHSFPEISVKLEPFSHDLSAVSLTEGVAKALAPVGHLLCDHLLHAFYVSRIGL